MATPSTSAVEQLQAQYIADLRILLDQAHSREERLANMLQVVIDERFYKPVVTGKGPQNVIEPGVDNETMQDVATFDEEEDRKLMDQQAQTERQLENEFADIYKEQFGAEAVANPI